MLRRCYLGSMGFQILIWHGFVAPKLGVFFKEVKRAAIKRESKLNFCFFCVASYGGNPWGDREGHCWIFKNCLALKVGRIFVDFRNYAPASPEPPKICTPAFPSYSQSEVVCYKTTLYTSSYHTTGHRRPSRNPYPYQNYCNVAQLGVFKFVAACPYTNNKPQLVPINDRRSARKYRKSRLQRLTILLFYLPKASYPSNRSHQHQQPSRCRPLRLTHTSPSSPPP